MSMAARVFGSIVGVLRTSSAAMAAPGAALAWVRRELRVVLRDWRRSRVAKRKTRSKKTYVLAVVWLLLLGLFGWSLAYLAPSSPGRELSVDQLSALASANRVDWVQFTDEDARIVGEFACATSKARAATASAGKNKGKKTTKSATDTAGKSDTQLMAPLVAPNTKAPPCPRQATTGTSPFWVSYPKSDAATALLLQLVTDAGARVTIDPQVRKGQVRIAATLVLPLMILATLFVLLFTGSRASSSGIGEVELFGSIGKGRFGRRKKSPTTFAEVAGADEAVKELAEVRDYLADPNRYLDLGAQPPKGVLLIGPPGCGKTLLAKATAGEVGVPFFSVAGAEFVESLVGVGAARVRDLFARVRAAAPAVVFIDELDAAGRKRGAGGAGGNEEREQTLNQILVEMDGFDVSSGIVVMGATNRPDILDPALLRPGRFDRHVTVDRPDMAGRTKILELHAQGKPFTADVDFLAMARRTPGFSGADLANVINEAVLLAIRAGKVEIDPSDVAEAVHRTVSGTIRRARSLTPAERKRLAFHESAHVVVAAATGRFDEVHRVSILGGGRTLGSMSLAGEEAAVITRTQMESRLAIHLAGVAAEELVFGEMSSGGENDITAATALARDMVGRYGMSARLGTVRLLALDVDEFLDVEVPLAQVSGATHQEIDAEIKAVLDEARREATSILSTHRLALDTLAGRLEEVETLEGNELEELLTEVQPEMDLFGSLVKAGPGVSDRPVLSLDGDRVGGEVP